MKGWIAALMLLMPLAVAAQQAPRHNDFAYGLPLEVDGDGALYSFDLPGVVYRYSTRPDLGDMRIFNGYGEVVPHLLRPGVRKVKSVHAPVALHFFPLYDTAGEHTPDTRIHIATDEDGAVVDFWQQAPQQGTQRVGRYLIDASQLERSVEKLKFTWDDTAESVLESVSLEYSNDLNNWQPLVNKATLASLRYNDLRLGKNEISLPSVTAKYYRLSWPLGKRGILLNGVQAVVQQEGDEVARQWMTLQPSGDATHRGDYDFSTGGYYPINRIRIKLPQANTVVRVKLFSRSGGSDHTWRLRHQGLAYNLQREGYTLNSDPIDLGSVSDPQWRLEVESEDGGVGRGEPKLELGWVPHRVYFVARGETPFSLAFGAAEVKASRNNTLTPLLNTLKQSRNGNGFIKAARPGPYFQLGGPRRLEPAPPPRPWRQWVLWGVLVLGVIMLAMMARSLYRQMRDVDRID